MIPFIFLSSSFHLSFIFLSYSFHIPFIFRLLKQTAIDSFYFNFFHLLQLAVVRPSPSLVYIV